MPHLSGCPKRSFGRSNANLHPIGFVVAGIIGPGFLFRCSATELRQRSQPVGIEPTTIGLIEVTRSFTTPQTFLRCFLHFDVLVSLLRTRTPLASSQNRSAVHQVINTNGVARNWRLRA